MPLFKVDELRRESKTKLYSWDFKGFENLDEYAERKLNEQASQFRSYKTYDIFLSYSVKDAAAIIRLANILENKGLSVYVDWIVDKKLDRSEVTAETARIIRDRLESSKSLILALTSNSVQSNWVQWELGLGDGQKNGKVAILPLIREEDTNPNFYRQEYLGIYPFIDYQGSSIYVNGKGVKYLKLEDWLVQSDPLEELLYS